MQGSRPKSQQATSDFRSKTPNLVQTSTLQVQNSKNVPRSSSVMRSSSSAPNTGSNSISWTPVIQPANKSSIALQKKYIQLATIRKHQPLKSFYISERPNSSKEDVSSHASFSQTSSLKTNGSPKKARHSSRRISTFKLKGQQAFVHSVQSLPSTQTAQSNHTEYPPNNDTPGVYHKTLFEHLMAETNLENILHEKHEVIEISNDSEDQFFYEDAPTELQKEVSYVPPTISRVSSESPSARRSAHAVRLTNVPNHLSNPANLIAADNSAPEAVGFAINKFCLIVVANN